ncbi:LegC family aminotransferase [Aporhodopirellula aestuarii]|uniref:LegC family aminotransferase n=1 Tax=Aporhodopirellula aestuarii TaxID=2950107 RepID=A0ABT0UAC8_9BACT|nr:LegC family aminotransferase [Aporhodopirellula aestuarii]MCM2373846.1 LegC family aminotransferase [Aporhodopirellula aestuarii]
MTSIEQLSSETIAAIENAIGPQEEFVLLHRPYLPPNAWQYMKECLDTGWVSSAGSFVARFEEELAKATGCARAVATVNGTAALEVCFRITGVSVGDEVICPSLSFVATANAISHCQAVPHFVDVSESCLSICPEALSSRLSKVAKSGADGTINRETGRRIAAVCLMHCFGHPGELDDIVEICEKYDIPFIEDAAESLGSYYKGKHTGRFGKVSAVSFNGNKIITTGGGGAVLTDDHELADRAKHLTTTAKVPHKWEFRHDNIAWNFRMPNLNAALGVAQLEVLPELLNAKRELARLYLAQFSQVDGVKMLAEPADCRSNHWLNSLLLDVENESARDSLLGSLNESGYQCRPVWLPMHQLEIYEDCPRGSMEQTESISRRALNIPSSADLAPNWSASLSQ